MKVWWAVWSYFCRVAVPCWGTTSILRWFVLSWAHRLEQLSCLNSKDGWPPLPSGAPSKAEIKTVCRRIWVGVAGGPSWKVPPRDKEQIMNPLKEEVWQHFGRAAVHCCWLLSASDSLYSPKPTSWNSWVVQTAPPLGHSVQGRN